MALKPEETGADWKGSNEHGLSHEEGDLANQEEARIDAELAIRNPLDSQYRIDFPDGRVSAKVLAELRRRYEQVGWQTSVEAQTIVPGDTGPGLLLRLTRPAK